MVSVVSIFKQLLGTLVALIGGWFGGVVCIVVIGFTGIGGDQRGSVVAASLMEAVVLWVYLIPLWIVVLIPLYLAIPRKSLLLRPYIFITLGALAGLLFAALVSRGNIGSTYFICDAV